MIAVGIGEAHRQFAAQHAFFRHHQANQLFSALLALHLQRFTANKVAVSRFPRDGPAHIGGQRRDAFVHLLTVEVHPRFQTQRIARAQTRRLHARFHQRAPEIGGLLVWHRNFVARFTGVAGGGDKQIARLHAEERLHAFGCFALLGGKQRRGFRLRVRTLHGDQRQIVTDGDIDGIRFGVLGDPGEVFFAGGGVYNEAEEIFSEVIDD